MRSRLRAIGSALVLALLALAAPPAWAQQTGEPAPAEIDDETAPEAVRELTVKECVLLALANNLGLRASALDPDVARALEEAEKGIFDPVVRGVANYANSESPTGSLIDGATVNTSDIRNLELGVSQLTPIGSVVGVRYNQRRLATNSRFATLNPSYTGSVTVEARQPLLKDGWLPFNESGVRIARNNVGITEYGYRRSAEDLAFRVLQAYWNLVFFLEDVEVKKESLSLAEEELGITRNKIETGVLAERDVYFSLTSVASRKADVVAAENLARDAADFLKRLIMPLDRLASWEVPIEPKERPTTVDREAIDEWIDSARLAFGRRAEIQQARLDLENKRIAVKVAENQALPSLDLFGSFAANALNRDIDDNLDDIAKSDFESWVVGVEVEVPWGLRAGRNRLIARRIEVRQALLGYADLQNQVVQEVREATRAIESAWEVIQFTREATVSAKNQLEAEREKYRVGTTTQYQVLLVQNDLAEAQRDENRARKDYRVALARLRFAEGSILEMAELGITLPPGG